jgi:ribosomal protein L37AE/L43A
MRLLDFFSKYPDEVSCKAYFKEQRASEHINCKQCGSLHIYWQEKESRWRCKECKHAMGLKKGTVMENSNLGYRIWLWGLFLMSLTKKGFSALEVQRLIKHKRYEPIWLMMQKIRISMGQRDEKYQLDGYIEMDEGFFEGHRKKVADDLIVKPTKELDRQVRAIVAVSTTPIVVGERKDGRPITKPGYLKMNVVKSLSKIDIGYEANKMIGKNATVTTDGKTSYKALKDICIKHIAVIIEDKTKVSKAFPWVHTAISNAKKKVLGLHHHVKDNYMQNYLNEFCYKFNRRYFGENLFERLVIASLQKAWYST